MNPNLVLELVPIQILMLDKNDYERSRLIVIPKEAGN